MNRMEKKPTANTAAYDLYLRGLYASGKGTREALEEAMRCYEADDEEGPDVLVGVLGVGQRVPPGDGNVLPAERVVSARQGVHPSSPGS